LDDVRRVLSDHRGIGTATSFDGLLIVRLIAADVAQLRAAVISVAGEIRRAAAGLPPRLPQVWYC
jgi:urease accessory protein